MKASRSTNLHLVACVTKSVSVGYDFAKSHRIELKFCTQKNFIVRLTFVSMTIISASEGPGRRSLHFDVSRDLLQKVHK